MKADNTICNDRISLPGVAGCLGGAVRPPMGPGQNLVGVQRAKPPEAPVILQYTVPKKCPPKTTFLVHFYLCAAYKLKGKIHLN